MAWTDYSSAPAAGTAVCDAASVDGVLPISLTTERGVFPILVVRTGGQVLAYVNACPHQYLRLDYRGDQLLSANGTMLMCTAHGARFDILTGDAVAGADCGLDAVPVEVVDGTVVIAES